MWLGHYESEVKQPDLNKIKLLNIRRHPSCKDLQLICGWDIMNKQPDLNKTKQLKMRRYRSCKDSQ